MVLILSIGVPAITDLSYDTLSTSLACITGGGPVTNITWMQDQLELVADSQTVLIQQNLDVSTVVYWNTLVLRRGRERENVGTYRCLVSNVRGGVSMELTVAGECNVVVVRWGSVFIALNNSSCNFITGDLLYTLYS